MTMMNMHRRNYLRRAVGVPVLLLAACQPGSKATPEATTPESGAATPAPPTELVVYSGRKASLIGPLLERFEKANEVDLKIKYAKTGALAATILEESGAKSVRAEVFIAQDAGGLGLIAAKGLFKDLPESTLAKVAKGYKSRNGDWVGVSGRARTLVYNAEKVKTEDLPRTLDALTAPEWKGKVGWAPSNASFQAHVTALRQLKGEAATKAWLEAMKANDTKVYPKNTPIVEAVGRGEIELGLVNHYYLHKLNADGRAKAAKNWHLGGKDTLVNVAGVGILVGTENPLAQRLVDFLLSAEAQAYFAKKTFEYPVVGTATAAEGLVPFAELEQPDLDLSSISDLEGTLKLLKATKALP